MGSNQYLKEKFGTGYMFEARVNAHKEPEFQMFMKQLFMRRAMLIDNFLNQFQYSIPKECIKSLSFVFERLEKGINFDFLIKHGHFK